MIDADHDTDPPSAGPAAPRGGAAGSFFTLRPLHIDLGDVIVQIFAVALGVILGFAATAWNDRLHAQSLLHETVANIVAELHSNQTGLHAVMPQHAKLAAQLKTLLARAQNAKTLTPAKLVSVVRGSEFGENIPLSIAWQIAQNDQGLTLLPYDDRYDLAWIYELQNFYYASEQRFVNLLFTQSEPPDGNYGFTVSAAVHELDSIVATEHRLDGLYTAAARRAHAEFGV